MGPLVTTQISKTAKARMRGVRTSRLRIESGLTQWTCLDDGTCLARHVSMDGSFNCCTLVLDRCGGQKGTGQDRTRQDKTRQRHDKTIERRSRPEWTNHIKITQLTSRQDNATTQFTTRRDARHDSPTSLRHCTQPQT